MFATVNWSEIAMVAIAFGVVVIKVALLLGLAYWLVGKTTWGRSRRRLSDLPPGDMTLEITDQLRAIQAQLEELHARVDFAERVVIEQRDQLHALGIEPQRHSPVPTPI